MYIDTQSKIFLHDVGGEWKGRGGGRRDGGVGEEGEKGERDGEGEGRGMK